MRVIRDDKDAIEFAASRGSTGAQLSVATVVAILTAAFARHLSVELLQVNPLNSSHRVVTLLIGSCAWLGAARCAQPYALAFDRQRRVLSIIGGWRYLYPTYVEHHVREIFDLAYEDRSGSEGGNWAVELWLKWGEKKRLATCYTEREAKDTVAQLRSAIFE